jgi:probable phosphoglycerate mutase
MRHLVLVRHGESELNATNRTTRTYCGQFETPLTAVGREQALVAGEQVKALSYLNLEAAVSSPLQRAKETLALLLRRLQFAVEVLPPLEGLAERSHGAFEGLTEEQAFRDYPHYRDDPAYCDFMDHFEKCAPGGETLAIVTERAWSAVQQLTAETNSDLILVSHFNPIRCIVGRALGLSPAETLRLHVPNAAPIVLAWNGSYKLLDSPDLRRPE